QPDSDRACSCVTSTIRESHRLLHVIEGLARDASRLLAALGDDAAHQIRTVLELLRALPHRGDFLDHPLDEWLLAVEATNTGRAAAILHPCLRLGARVELVQIPHRTFFRIAGIVAANASGIGLHGLELGGNRI